MGVDDTHVAGETVDSGLPNIKGELTSRPHTSGSTAYGGAIIAPVSGAFEMSYRIGESNAGVAESSTNSKSDTVYFDASKYDSIYGASDIVQPPAYYVYTWQRMGYLLTVTSNINAYFSVTKNENSIYDSVYASTSVVIALPEGGEYTIRGARAIDGFENNDYYESKVMVSKFGFYRTDVTPAYVFGVAWDYGQESTSLTRLTAANDPNNFVTKDITSEPVAAVGTSSGSSPFDAYAPWSGMDEYNIVDNTVGPKYGETGFSRTDNDTMVYIPEFYYKVVDDASNKKRYYYISDCKFSNFEKHPGSGKYVGRYNTVSSIYSKSGISLSANRSRSSARTIVKNKGDKWSLYSYASWCAIGLLYAVEYADWDSQTKIGKGVTDNASVVKSGTTDSMEYHTGRADGTDGKTAVKYRNIENPWGNVYEFIDGINVNGAKVYVCTDQNKYRDDTSDGYILAGTRATSDGYVSQLGYSTTAPWSIYPAEVNGSESTYIPDYSNPGTTGWKAFYCGGGSSTGSKAGLFMQQSTGGSGDHSSGIGERLQFNP